ncbi:MAG TPA: 16S rRNA (cytosine(1402)-N(4))-methyltransferase RsmH [Candidatus Margulisiibacteriota bacterium]|nr:16S rRNA (cytosine(1402)-N(4))-methyltransferase RsmH [Candidatus Margulisiibacteriota bacterium]
MFSVTEDKLHTPVMLQEVLEYLDLSPGKLVVDATLGLAGHSKALLERILPGGRLIGIDRDEESLKIARVKLSGFADSVELVQGNFVDIDNILRSLKINKIDAALFDLGVSSFQLSDPQRGFSFQSNGPLDMRLDRNSYVSAYDLVNNLNEDEISSLLWNFGQERWHNRIAHLLVEERQRHPIATTSELVSIVERAIPSRYRHRYYRIHPATRTFQAVRIAVNRELEILEEAINKSIALLNKDARICVISFHSLEDRAVKWAFRKAAAQELIKIITPKPLTPRESEVRLNPSARSSKLRVAEKL